MNKKISENIYYDIQITNLQSTNNQQQPLIFSETRNIPIVNNSGDYSLSIVRFEIDTYSLPTFIAEIEPSQNDPNKMIETITLEYDASGTLTTVGPLNLSWIPTNEHIPVPAPPNPLQDTQTEYYYGNSFRHYCDLVNNCFETLTESLKLASGEFSLNTLLPPKLIWNEHNQTASLIGQEEFYNWSRATHVNIYFNRPLYSRFTSLPALKNFNKTLNRTYKIYMMDDLTTKSMILEIGGFDVLFIKTSQEYSTISNWSPVASIVFTSNVLPIVASQQSEPLIYSNNQLIRSSVPQKFEKVISDMATNEMTYKPNLLYVPSAEYRRISLTGNSEIRTVDINVYWKDKIGILHQFYLQSGASFSCKLLFEKLN